MDTALSRPGLARRFPVRQLLILALVGLLAVAAAAYFVGSQKHPPTPFGPAGNGLIAYTVNGDIYVRDSLSATGRVLISEPGDQVGPGYSPDGTWLLYNTTIDGKDHVSVAKADGTSAHEIALIPPTGNAQAAWSPDSTSIAFIYDVNGLPQLSIAPVNGAPATVVALGDIVPLDVSWSPPSGEFLLLRARIQPGQTVDLLRVRPDGSGLQMFGLPGQSAFGSGYTLSGSTFAPNGKSIAYNSIETDPVTLASHFRIGIVVPDGTGRQTLPGPAESYVQEGWPAFSPDGKWILVHRWIFKGDSGYATPESWLAVMPADGSAPAHDVGPRFQGGEDASLNKIWSPDGSRIIAETGNTNQVFSIDPVSGESEQLPWTPVLPDWQRIALP